MDRYQEMTAALDFEALELLRSEGRVQKLSITKATSLGVKEVFDISVDRLDGLFSLNGVAIHNCKESLISRGYSQANMLDSSAVVRLTFEGKQLDIPLKTRVKFWDPENNSYVLGPLSIPIGYGWPIDRHSVERMMARESYRVMDD